jgi:6-pyruvoyl-tetrahydropterin synthase
MGYDEFDADDLDDKDLLCYKFVITTHESSYVADQNNVENIFIDIIEIEDEYYLVDIQEEHLIAHGGGKYSTNYITKNYKCDQWDGLEKLLKDKGLL